MCKKHTLAYLILQRTQVVNSTLHILQVRKLRLRNIERFAQDPWTVRTSWEPKPKSRFLSVVQETST